MNLIYIYILPVPLLVYIFKPAPVTLCTGNAIIQLQNMETKAKHLGEKYRNIFINQMGDTAIKGLYACPYIPQSLLTLLS